MQMTTQPPMAETLCSEEKISAYGPARSTIKGTPLSAEELRRIDAYWRASLYLCLGMLYLKEDINNGYRSFQEDCGMQCSAITNGGVK